ncbi:T9SS type A sorting domain-containing protein [Hymenobacter weizhouensis]|uniref:T9SS type A sorting domain-containing protein n=1 Tax=Hymenobacter sp. YIM 151500-1 TaxID=2987689 RepID=UPI0022262A2C|nr:T9SS type A sorting domain-containing protein [Hymenobacter sp. YIM 151500-1]UYZ62858.1 T9SS type A sorting domain-containing protein [Hymenobacter sp. YIM 151500-1]
MATQFDPSTKRSRIINLADSSLLLDAWVLRHRRLYYVVEPQANSSCWVHAVQIRDGEVRGLLTGFLQMSHLAAAVRKGYAAELVRYRHPEPDSIRLRFDIKHLRTFYAAELDSLPAYRLQQSARQASVLPASAIAVPARLYPNPAHTRATLDFSYAGRRTVQLFNTRGQQVRTYDSLAATLDIPVDGLPAGRYIVRIVDAAARPHMLQLEVAH